MDISIYSDYTPLLVFSCFLLKQSTYNLQMIQASNGEGAKNMFIKKKE